MGTYCEPMVSTRISNPTKEQQTYRWIDNGVITLEPGQETILPFEVSTATPADNRYLIETDLKEKRVTLEYLIRGVPSKQVNSLSDKVQTSETEGKSPDLFEAKATTPYDAAADQRRADAAGVQQPLAPRKPVNINFMSNNDVVKQAADQTNPTAVPGQQVKTFREVMGWPKTPVARAPEPVKLGDAWAASMKKPRA